ncbi:hypothetical protein QE152_g14305 [Popillia japonica]|uniref:Chitin deacetylase n=1 Tax=Popillia japonica TaxID=7064 RepID=A0AAW1L9Y2_POPJA
MKLFLSVTVLLAFIALAASQGCEQEVNCLEAIALAASQGCEQEVNCLEANGCRCATTQSPLPLDETPQLVICSFNDAITELAYTTYYEPLFSGRMNPDFYPVSATFFVPHEYTDYRRVNDFDYRRVNDLYREGHEIAVHSITKDPLTEYWLESSVSNLKDEFEGQMRIISRFANIPVDDISGARVPNMALAGDNLFNALSEIAKLSVPPASVPFTLDYGSQVICASGVCPQNTHAGMWVTPIINIMGDGVECNNLQACRVEGTAQEIANWLIREFNVLYQGNRAPMNLVLSSAWFMATENSLQGLHGNRYESGT